MADSSPIVSSQGLDIEERFAHLLNPIRDIAENWEVDLARDLEIYLSEIVNHVDPSQNGVSSFNFAQAALLIQGSTCIYSKKVEYLHRLVYQSFEEMTSNKKKKAPLPGSITNSGRDQDLTFDNAAEDYMTLDDIEDVRDSLTNNNRRESVLRTSPRMPLPISPVNPIKDGNVNGANGEAEHKGDFKLNTCHLHRLSGTLLLSLCNAKLMNGSAGLEGADVPNREVHAAPCPVPDVAAVDHEDYGDPPMDNLAADDDDSLTDGSMPLPPPILRDKRRNVLPQQPDVRPLEAVKLNDDHEEAPTKRNLRRKVEIKLPPVIVSTKKSRKRKADGCTIKVKAEPTSPIGKFCEFNNFSKLPLFPKSMRQIPNFQLLEDLYFSALKRRRELLAAHHKTVKDQVQQEDLNSTNGGDDMDDDVVDNDVGPNSPFGHDEQQVDLDNLGVDTGREERRKSVLPTNNNCVEAIDAPIPSSYESLVQNFLMDNKFCRITDIGQRVNEWAERINPKLAQEEARAAYDIHEYGTRILNCFQDNNRKQTLPFSHIVHGYDRSEVSRLFLASLQLANTENVHISTAGILEEGMDTMELTLLSRKRHHEELQDFRAPSQ